MSSFTKILLLSACCLYMAGCSTFFEDEGPRETVYATGEADIDMTYPEMAREMSNGSVQVFSLDGPPAPVMLSSTASAPRIARQGVTASRDPNVTVYPFDDDIQPLSEQRSPLLAPPSRQYRPLQSPFGGPIQTPAPAPNESGPYTALVPPASDSDTSRLYFKHGSARVNPTGKDVIDYVAQTSAGPIVVDGHASRVAEVSDPIERQIVNLEMSMERAVEVSSHLIRSGVPVERIETRAFGDSRPAAPVSGVDQSAANRRVEIHTEGGAVYPMTSSYQPLADGTDLTEPAPIPPLARY